MVVQRIKMLVEIPRNENEEKMTILEGSIRKLYPGKVDQYTIRGMQRHSAEKGEIEGKRGKL